HYHLIGICGTAMASLAGMLQARGHHVTGSDENVYPPMSTMLAALGIPVMQGYRAENLNVAVGSEQWSVGSEQWAVSSGQRAAGTRQKAEGGGGEGSISHPSTHTPHPSPFTLDTKAAGTGHSSFPDCVIVGNAIP